MQGGLVVWPPGTTFTVPPRRGGVAPLDPPAVPPDGPTDARPACRDAPAPPRDVVRQWDRIERTVAGLKAARARGRKGGRKFALAKAQVRLAQAAMAHRDTSVAELCRELGIRPVTLYRYVGPQGQLREQGQKVLAS